ncbi:glycosyltransferase family 1 protein [Prescottella agglutinans]|uniref:Glycosyltransferase family 1 protein n=1 Tax=Prescottella agglutinans TaxID=1644129 RepID=A0A3S3AIY3_9NOCA|nr:glycosyltransferase family 1 protein [Prescottella agglutinans]RVW09326.1 glycosyltransferase family 1 protein [Prescottella agglutinans]
MKVLMPGRILERHVGGNTTYARTLASGLRDRGVEVSSMRYVDNPVGTLALETAQALARPVPDQVLHYVADTGPLISTRSPSVVTVHGVASKWVEGVRKPHAERVWRARVGAAIKRTNRVITVSESSADDIADVFGVERESISVILHGIDCEKFARSRTLSEDISAKVPSEFLLYVGNIEPRKNLVELVEAMSCGPLADAGLPLLIAGKPAWDSEESMAAITASRNVRYLGFISEDDKIALMQRCTAFVFPSKYEGFGFPVLEAMAAGAPVVTSQRGALREVAGPAMVTADIDRESIAASVRDALGDSEWLTTAPERGRAWASTFSWDKSVDAHVEVYRSVVDR